MSSPRAHSSPWANAQACGKIRVLSIADLVGEAIVRSYRGDSVTSLFV